MILARADQLLARWRFAASVHGRLWVQPVSRLLSAAELVTFLKRIQRADSSVRFREVVFDLSEVETIGPQWTLVLALLVDFARRVEARCKVVSLHGQPAAAAALYRRNRELMSLIDFSDRAA
ncbi:MAG: hypothetical protein ACE5F9_13565 [Phycisphaerae bacterium]